MKKYLLSTLFVAMAAAPILALAEEAIAPEPGAKLLVWTEPDAVQLMQKLTAEFAKKHDVQFEVKEQSPIESIGRLIQDGGNAKVADVLEFEHDNLGPAVSAGVLMENLVSADQLKDNFVESAFAASQAIQDGEVITYGFPISFGTTALFYNKDILPEAPKTFEELVEMGKTFSSDSDNKYALLWDIQNYYESRMFLAMFGGYEFGEGGKNSQQLGIGSAESIKGVEAMVELKPITAKSAADMSNSQVRRGLFTEGKVAAIIDGPWAIATYDASGINYGIAPMPTYKGQSMPNFASVKLVGVSAFTEYPKAAQLFADYLTSEEVMLERHKVVGSIPARKSAIEKMSQDSSNTSNAFAQQGLFAQSMPAIPEMGYIWQPMSAALSDIWDKNVPVQDALTKAATTIEQQIATQKSN